MKELNFLLFLILSMSELHAQNYLISFTAKGASATIDSILVENLTQGTTLTLPGENVLYLRAIVSELNDFSFVRDNAVRLYPNPMAEYCTLEINVASQAEHILELYHASGQMVASTQAFLSQGRHTYRVNGLKSGLYTIRIKLPEGIHTAKIISHYRGNDMVRIIYQGQAGSAQPENPLKSTLTPTQMQYTQDDRLKFTGFQGIRRTILTDIPTQDTTITFEFADCMDGDNNTCAAVQIGTQLWMAENLKTTRYIDGSKIPLVTNDSIWRNLTTPAYCWYSNDSAMYAPQYGALYDWWAIAGGNLCPSGWYVPSDEDWNSLITYLTDNGFGFKSSGDDYGKSLAATAGWWANEVMGTAGNNQASNNATGFSALPAGYRNFDGTFKDMGSSGNWWSFTGKEPDCFAFYRSLQYNSLNLYYYKIEREFGFSIRCLKDRIL